MPKTISVKPFLAEQKLNNYKRTSAVTADLNFFYHSEDKKNMSERTYSLKLEFADETQGLASGSYTYSFDLNKGSKYESKDSGSKNVKNAIFTIK